MVPLRYCLLLLLALLAGTDGYRRKKRPPTNPLVTPAPESGCVTIVLRSNGNSQDKKQITNGQGQPADIISMDLLKQLSHYKCVEWRNYFFFGSYVVAKHGCSGRFKVCYKTEPTTAPLITPPPGCQIVRLLSRLNRRATQTINVPDGRIISMTISKEFPQGNPCVRGSNYGFNGLVVFAEKGCRADFQICFSNEFVSPPTGEKNCQKFIIVEDTRKTIVDSDNNPVTITQVKLIREISRNKCVEGATYLSRESLFIVKNGCKGAFRVCYEKSTGELTVAPPTTNCKEVVLRSRYGKTEKQQIVDANGNPAEVISMDLLKQLGHYKCREWQSYYFRESYVFVTKGCEGKFNVCYKQPTNALTEAPPSTAECKKYVIIEDTRTTVVGSNNQPAEITQVKLIREISRNKCVEGTTYFFIGSVFVVRNGCKGAFKVCYEETGLITTPPPDDHCKDVVLRSRYGKTDKQQIVDANGNPAEVISMELLKQLGHYKCREWQSYYFRESYVFVTKGCEGKFKVCYKPPTNLQTTAPPETNECKKYIIVEDKRTTVTDSNNQPATITKVKLIREISSHKCVKGTTYFFSGSVFVVRNGCKGAFKVCYSKTGLVTTLPPDDHCKKVVLRSRYGKTDKQQIVDASGNPAEVISMELLKQLGHYKCREGQSYYFRESYVFVTKGCEGKFKVCYKPPTDLQTTAPPVERGCKLIALISQVNKPVWKTVTGDNGAPVYIKSIDLYTQYAGTKCVEWRNFYASGNKVHAKDGCRGLFKVCYKQH